MCPFEGETALHMCIEKWSVALSQARAAANNDARQQILERAKLWENMVGKLVEKFPVLLRSRATGVFFLPSGNCYYGELPLLWAASFGDVQIIQKLLNSSHADKYPETRVLKAKDKYGGFACSSTRCFWRQRW